MSGFLIPYELAFKWANISVSVPARSHQAISSPGVRQCARTFGRLAATLL
jgi:hypothetical protein